MTRKGNYLLLMNVKCVRVFALSFPNNMRCHQHQWWPSTQSLPLLVNMNAWDMYYLNCKKIILYKKL